MNRLRRTSQVDAPWLGCWTGGGYVRSVHAPEPPLCVSFAGVALKCEGTIVVCEAREAVWECRVIRDKSGDSMLNPGPK